MLTKTTKILLVSSALVGIRCGVSDMGDKAGQEDHETSTESVFENLYSSLGLSDSVTEEEELAGEVAATTPAESLGEAALEVFSSVRAQREAYKADKEAICEKDTDLRKSVKEQLEDVKADGTLSDEEKREQAKAIFSENKDAVMAEKEEFKACVEENKADLEVIKEQEKALADACLIKPERSESFRGEADQGNQEMTGKKRPRPEGADGHNTGPGKGRHAGHMSKKKPHIQWNDELIAELEAQLLTPECSAALSATEDPADD